MSGLSSDHDGLHENNVFNIIAQQFFNILFSKRETTINFILNITV